MKKFSRIAFVVILLALCLSMTSCSILTAYIGAATIENANAEAEEEAADWAPAFSQEMLLQDNHVSVKLLHMERNGILGSYIQLAFHLQFDNQSNTTVTFPNLSVLLNGYRFENAPSLTVASGESTTHTVYATCALAAMDIIGPVSKYVFNLDCFNEQGSYHTNVLTASLETEHKQANTLEKKTLLNEKDFSVNILTHYVKGEEDICLFFELENTYGATTLNISIEDFAINGIVRDPAPNQFALDDGEKKLLTATVTEDDLPRDAHGALKSVSLTLKVKKRGVEAYLINKSLSYDFPSAIKIS